MRVMNRPWLSIAFIVSLFAVQPTSVDAQQTSDSVSGLQLDLRQNADSLAAGCYILEHTIIPFIRPPDGDSIREVIPVRLDAVRHIRSGKSERILWNVHALDVEFPNGEHPFGHLQGAWSATQDSITVVWATGFTSAEFVFPLSGDGSGRSKLWDDIGGRREGRVLAKRISCDDTCRFTNGFCAYGRPVVPRQ